MKVAVVNSGGLYSGTGRMALEITRRLMRQHQVDHVFLNYRNRTVELDDASGKRVLTKYTRLPEQRYFFYWRSQKKVPPYDLYHIATQNLSYLQLRPKVVTCLDLIHQAYPESLSHYLVSKFVYSGLAKANAIIAISEATKKDLIRLYGIPSDRIEVVYPGVDTKTFAPGLPTDELRERYELPRDTQFIAHVSSERPRKNLDAVLRAFYLLRKEFGVDRIKVVKGGGIQYRADRERTLATVEKLGLQEDVILLDNLSDRLLAQLYNLADVFVFPSYYEGFGLPPLEAMACGTPVIVSNATSLPEVVGDAGIIVDPDSPHSLAKALHSVLTDESLRQDLRRRGLERASSFDWEKAANQVLKVYEASGR